MSYLKRTGTGINDVTWDETPLATEEYVNTTVTTAVPAGKYVETTGGTMTGELVLSGKPTQDNGAANKKYVDDAISGAAPAGDYVNKSGDTMTGNLNMNNNQITNVDTPSDNNDAANKQYVDAVDTKVTNLEGEVTGVKNTVANITNGSTELPYLSIAGGTLTGALTLSGAPTADLQAATKKYIDDKANDKTEVNLIPSDGITINTSLCFRHNKFLFMNIGYYDANPIVLGNQERTLFTIDNSVQVQDMLFYFHTFGEGMTADNVSLGQTSMELGCKIQNNVIKLLGASAVPTPSNLHHAKAGASYVITCIFSVID